MSEITIAKMQKDIDHIKENVDDIKEYIKEDRAWKVYFAKCIDEKYASNQRVDHLQWVVYGVLGVLSFIGIFLVNNFLI